MARLEISLFGKFCLRCDELPPARLAANKPLELLAYLLLCRDQSHTRENLANLLWPNCSTSQSKRYLRKALWQIQSALTGHAGPAHGGLLLLEADHVRIEPTANIWLDVAVFEQTFHSVYRRPGRILDLQEIGTLCAALALYQGGLLEGWYQDWCLYERERFQHMYLAMLDKVIDFCAAHGKYAEGLSYAARIMQYDRARERTHRQMMRLQYLEGDRTAALRQYERCATALKEELGVRPARSTVALYEQICMDCLQGPSAIPVEMDTASAVTTPSTPQVSTYLIELRGTLAQLQHLLQRTINTIDLATSNQR